MYNTKIAFLSFLVLLGMGFSHVGHSKTLVITDSSQPAVVVDRPAAGGIDYKQRDEIVATPSLEHVISPPKQTHCVSEQGYSPLFLDIYTGDLLSEKMTDWAKTHGYNIVWEGPEYKAQGNLNVKKNFEETLADVRAALATHGINFTITIYQNCVVRFVEDN